MRIRDMLRLKGGAIYSVEPATRVAEAVTLMVHHDVGSLVVTKDGAMIGMLTFREVLKALDASGGIDNATVADIMLRDPIYGSPDDTIDELREVMTQHHVRYLPVKDGDALVGVVSFHDAAKAIIKETTLENRLLRRYIEADPADAETH